MFKNLNKMERSKLSKKAAEEYPMHLDYQTVYLRGYMQALEDMKENEFTVIDMNMAINLSRHINHTVWETKQNDIIEQIKALKNENNTRDYQEGD